jgi:hypothetical protein
MASFADGYAKHDGSFTVAAASILNGPKYLINPDLRAKRLISLSTLVDMEFCKAFWNLTEHYGFQVGLITNTCINVRTLNSNANPQKCARYINTRGNWKNEKLCENTLPCGHCFSSFSFFQFPLSSVGL